jgi:hypothetical protein
LATISTTNGKKSQRIKTKGPLEQKAFPNRIGEREKGLWSKRHSQIELGKEKNDYRLIIGEMVGFAIAKPTATILLIDLSINKLSH